MMGGSFTEMNKDDIRLKNLIPLKPGQSGNPAGRPKGAKNLTTIMDEVITEGTWANIMAKLADQAMNGDVASAKLIIERKDGQARQHVQVSQVPAVTVIDASYPEALPEGNTDPLLNDQDQGTILPHTEDGSHQDIQEEPGQPGKDSPE